MNKIVLDAQLSKLMSGLRTRIITSFRDDLEKPERITEPKPIED